jgi:nucleotide-binding universal stress UspA family protein
MKIMTVYDGTAYGMTALRYALRKAREKSAELTAVHVFDRDMFVLYDAVPRVEEVARKEALRHLAEVEAILRTEAQGIKATLVQIEGNPEREIVNLAREEKSDLLFVPPRCKQVRKKSPCAVSVIPGTILVPVDHVTSTVSNLDHLVSEAKATGSRILLLGLIPVHIYSKDEWDELDRITVQTKATVKALRKMLAAQGVDAAEVSRSGYPDEEILRAASDHSISMIVFLRGSKKPSELTKAERLVQDEPDRLRVPVFSLPAQWQAI